MKHGVDLPESGGLAVQITRITLFHAPGAKFNAAYSYSSKRGLAIATARQMGDCKA